MLKVKKHKYAFVFIVFLSGIIGIILELVRAYHSVNFSETTLVTSFYFTTQSNFLVTVSSLFFLFKLQHKRWYKYINFITLINILMTAIVFHILLTPYIENIQYIHHHLHTITPLLFLMFYMLIYQEKLRVKSYWISIIYPLIYVLFVYLVIEPFYGDLIIKLLPEFQSARYVYPLLDPSQYRRGWFGLSLFLVGFAVPTLLIFSMILLFFKQKYDIKYNKKSL